MLSGIDTGGILFSRCAVTDDRNRSFLQTGTSASHRDRGGLVDVQGDFVVANPNPAGTRGRELRCIEIEIKSAVKSAVKSACGCACACA